MVMQSESSSPDISSLSRSLAKEVSRAYTLDEKYLDDGPFAFATETTNAKTQSPAKASKLRLDIPQIGLLEGSASESPTPEDGKLYYERMANTMADS